MKRKFIALILISLMLLTACGKNKKTPTVQPDESSKIPTSGEVSTQNTVGEENTEGTLQNEPTAKTFDRDLVKKLCEDSSYISRVKIGEATEGANEISFVVDYKGDLSNIKMTAPKNLTPGKEYLIFYKDDENGKVVPTKAEDSYVEIASTNDSTLSYVENRYKRQERKNLPEDKTQNSEKNNGKLNKDDKTSNKSNSNKSNGDN